MFTSRLGGFQVSVSLFGCQKVGMGLAIVLVGDRAFLVVRGNSRGR